ncbi:MAG: putative RDD family membrane protein YckC [Candidatus Azotimanducaceae bacterium]
MEYPNASMKRRLAALVYDFFLILGIWVLTLSILVAMTTETVPAGAAIPEEQAIPSHWLQLICYIEALLFNTYFWMFKGQTLGMQVWKIRVVDKENEILGLKSSIIRFAAATLSVLPLGLGFVWMFFTKGQLALHDLLSKTHVIYLGDKPYPSEVIEKMDRR